MMPFFWCLFLDPHLTTYQSNRIVQIISTFLSIHRKQSAWKEEATFRSIQLMKLHCQVANSGSLTFLSFCYIDYPICCVWYLTFQPSLILRLGKKMSVSRLTK